MIACDVQSREEDDLSEPPTPTSENEQKMVIEEGHYPIPQLSDDIQDPTPMSVNETVDVVPLVSVPHPQQPTEHGTNDTEEDGFVHDNLDFHIGIIF